MKIIVSDPEIGHFAWELPASLVNNFTQKVNRFRMGGIEDEWLEAFERLFIGKNRLLISGILRIVVTLDSSNNERALEAKKIFRDGQLSLARQVFQVFYSKID